ncbi:extracellular solute-binding protein [Sneathiella sp.]|uniref:extracellular solute-binding protein n=1 Tax=Sneathiella sp. TaxID=1964365 RepID=UPI0035673E45
MQRFLFPVLIFLFCMTAGGIGYAKEKIHAIAMHGSPAYPDGFAHFAYVNPDAPTGGTLHLGVIGSFDSLNPFLLRGVSPAGMGFVYQSLMTRSKDEPFTLYGNIAKTIEIASDRSWVIFNLNPQAKFSNGAPITAEDVLFSFTTLRDKGRPNVRTYYRKVEDVQILGPRRIRFSFEKEGRWEMPLILGLMSVLSKEAFTSTDFGKTSLTPFVGSGPYLIDKVEPGRRIIYKRDPDFWGWGLPQNKGRHNFETVIYDYFRDEDIAREAFKAHTLDARFENNAGKWKEAYGVQPNASPAYVKSEPKVSVPTPMLALVFNSRRPQFHDRRVREALTLAFDFDWINANILQGIYKRTGSYFENSMLAATGQITEPERSLLLPFADELPTDVFKHSFHLPRTDGTGRNRENLRKAQHLLDLAGWTVSNGALLNRASGAPFTIEFLVNNNDYIKFISPFQRSLEILGIQSTIRQADSASYQNRLNTYDFDMIVNEWSQSLSPGNEQAFYWSRDAAKTPGTRNYPGIALAAADHMIDIIAAARTRDELETATRALDRVLLWGYYVIPLYYTDRQWLAHWPEIKIPSSASFWGTSPDLWWYSNRK